jgi:sensor histidine kinase YesM
VPLTEEIQFLKQYLAIEQVRFSDRLRVAFEIDPNVTNALVPGFVLQPLVENALRHGLAGRSEVGTITITARRHGDTLVLTVQDDGAGLGAGREEGVGLTNTRERLTTMYGDAARLDLEPAPSGGTIATIRVPFRVAPSSVSS